MRHKHGNTTAELMVVACIVGLGAVMFVPSLEEACESYSLDWIFGVVTVLAIIGCCISAGAFWQRPILVVGATAICTAAGAGIGWVLIMHSLIFAVAVAALCLGYILYFAIIRGRRAEHETE